MAVKNIHAFTEPNGAYPGYVSINEGPQQVAMVTVRSPGHGGMRLATIELRREDAIQMAFGILSHYGLMEKQCNQHENKK